MAEFLTFKGLWPWPWPWIGSYCIPSCITRRPLRTCHISLKSKKLFVDGCTDVRTSCTEYSWVDGHWRPTLLGRHGGVDLKMKALHRLVWGSFMLTSSQFIRENASDKDFHTLTNRQIFYLSIIATTLWNEWVIIMYPLSSLPAPCLSGSSPSANQQPGRWPCLRLLMLCSIETIWCSSQVRQYGAAYKCHESKTNYFNKLLHQVDMSK